MPMVLWKALYQINTTDGTAPNNEQSGSNLAALTGDRLIVAWSDFTNTYGQGLGVPDSVGQVLDPTGAFAGPERHLSSFYLDGPQIPVDVVGLPNGGFVAVYQTNDQAFFTTGDNISFEVFDSSGSFVAVRGIGGSPPGFSDAGIFQIGDETRPAVTAFADNSFMFVYEDNSAGNLDLRGVTVNSSNVEQPFFTVDGAAADAALPVIDTLSNGNAVIAYQSAGAAGDILFSIRTPTGAAVTSGTIAGGAANETVPAIAALQGGSGGFVAVWQDAAGDGAGNTGIKVRLYSNAGAAAGGAFSANLTVTAGSQSAPTVAGLLDGGFLVAWVDEPSGDIRARRFDAMGAAIESEFVIATLDTLSQPKLTKLSDGRVAIAVTNTDGAGDPDVYAAIWDPRSSPVSGTSGNDVLTSLPGGGVVQGLAGNDVLYGAAGADSLDGGGGNDTFFEGAGDSVVEALGQGYDTVNTTRTSYTLGANIERVNFTGAGNFVGTGNNLANRFQSGAGDDRFVDVLGGADIFSGGAGTDTVDFRTSASGAVINIASLAHGGAAAGDSYSGIEKFLGSNTAADTMIGGGTGRWIFVGGGGNDVLTGGVKNDQLIGEGGNDTLSGGADRDSIDGGTGNDTMTGGGERDVFVYVDALFGNDTIADFVDDFDSLKVFSTVADNVLDFTISNNGTNSVTLTIGANSITINGLAPITITNADFVFY